MSSGQRASPSTIGVPLMAHSRFLKTEQTVPLSGAVRRGPTVLLSVDSWKRSNLHPSYKTSSVIVLSDHFEHVGAKSAHARAANGRYQVS